MIKMKTLRTIANVAVLSPIALVAGIVVLLAFAAITKGMSDEAKWGAALAFAIPFGLTQFAVAGIFPLGIAIHGFVAARERTPCAWAWWTILIFSVLWCFQFPLGTIVGGGIIVLLFALEPFRILRRGVEQGEPTISTDAPPNGDS